MSATVTNQPSTTPNSESAARRTELIDPATLMRIQSLELRAKLVVEGFFSGLNRSPYHGFSVEFSEYRQYSPGDDLRFLDWKLYARSDRYNIKRFEDETNLRCLMMLDASRSMSYGSLSYTKADYAKTMAATLAYFLVTQRDAVGLATFDERIREYVPARFRQGQLRRLMLALEQPLDGASTDLSLPLEQLAERATRRGMLILISDLMALVDDLSSKLAWLATRGHEVLLCHVLDPAELTFHFEQPSLFYDVESGRELYVDPATAREKYLSRLAEHIEKIRQTCGRLGIVYQQFPTDKPLEFALSEFLRSRMRGKVRPNRAVARNKRARTSA